MIHDQEAVAATLIAAGLCPVELQTLQRAAICNALRHAGGNRTHAAKSLRVSVRTLQRNIKSWMTQESGMNGNDDGFDNDDGRLNGASVHGDGNGHLNGNPHSGGEHDIFLAMIGGRRVQCSTVEDAVAIKTADDVIRNGGATTTLIELQRLIEVTRRYACVEATDKLSQCLVRQRAADFLTRTVNYQRPAERVSQ